MSQSGTILRDDQIAREIGRGVVRLMHDHGMMPLMEVVLANGRRADVIGLARDGELWIIEIKSGLADFRSDQKWQGYLEYADRFFFAVEATFPVELIPAECGLILADRFGGDFVRMGTQHPLVAARRKAMILRFARLAAMRLAVQLDPALADRPEAKEL